VRLWTVAGAQKSQPLAVLEGHTDAVTSLAYSLDSTLLAAGFGDGMLTLWGLKSGQELVSLQAHLLQIDALGWSPDGTMLLSAGPDALFVWGVRGTE
jgi:WD40 repeat protein